MAEAEAETVLGPVPVPVQVPVPKDWLPSFVIINYKVKRQNDDDGAIMCDAEGRVKFHAGMGASNHALLLYNIRIERCCLGIKRTIRGNPVYSALVAGVASQNLVYPDQRVRNNQAIRPQELVEPRFNRHYLLYIHGFSSNPSGVFASCRQYHQAHELRIVIPVLWADEQVCILGYLRDRRRNVPAAVRSFVSLLDYENAFPQRSLICHSMGNFLLQNMAKVYFEPIEVEERRGRGRRFCFDYIFMVAADVTVQLFNRDQNQDTTRGQNDGLCVVDLVQHSVHVLHSHKDLALRGRVVLNCCEQALGLYGYDPDTVHDEAAPKLVLRDCAADKTSDWVRHSYLFQDTLMQYYEVTMNTRINHQN